MIPAKLHPSCQLAVWRFVSVAAISLSILANCVCDRSSSDKAAIQPLPEKAKGIGGVFGNEDYLWESAGEFLTENGSRVKEFSFSTHTIASANYQVAKQFYESKELSHHPPILLFAFVYDIGNGHHLRIEGLNGNREPLCLHIIGTSEDGSTSFVEVGLSLSEKNASMVVFLDVPVVIETDKQKLTARPGDRIKIQLESSMNSFLVLERGARYCVALEDRMMGLSGFVPIVQWP
ncbi:MAG: hypothetical protein FLDDKLPJ_03316 [Phycisphaerae bacterium]|nr:hypothetical protein [Phycisphaerae bacterium]